MLNFELQKSYRFEELTNIQTAWEFSVVQLGRAEEESRISLYQTPRVAFNAFRYGAAYDQRLHSRKGFLSFGLFDSDNPATWSYDQLISNDAITVFPGDDEMKGSSPVGFRGSGIHFSQEFIECLAEQVYQLPLNALVPTAGIYLPTILKVDAIRAELLKWQQLMDYGSDSRSAIILRREESLALAVFDALYDASPTQNSQITLSDSSVKRALEMIHSSELESILARELCAYVGCSQRTLEKSFSKRFGVTPKKYIKCLRLSQVRRGLHDFDAQGCDSIIELAGMHGFWHMGQFAADYRATYGELPSETLLRI